MHWSRRRTRGRARERSSTSAPPASGGGTGPGGADRLATDPAAKKASAKYIDEELLSHLRSAGRMASEEPPPGLLGSERSQPGGMMQNWESWQGVEHVLREWGKQVRNLEQRLECERDALRGVRVLFQARDGLVRNSLTPVSGPSLSRLAGTEPIGLRPAG
ncbi:hypothetical protein [Streptomyces sp. 3N207]|uniref:hypothetical protein n=1 Tax=Streptomyces sp. 3N207 TaxID=3457417 RepID=UPI003FCF4EC0